MKLIVTLCLCSMICFLTGCTTYWYQENKTFSDCTKDRAECVAGLQKYYDLGHIGKPEIKFMEDCMIQKGYMLVPEDKLPPKVKRQDPDTSLDWRIHGIAGTVD